MVSLAVIPVALKPGLPFDKRETTSRNSRDQGKSRGTSPVSRQRHRAAIGHATYSSRGIDDISEAKTKSSPYASLWANLAGRPPEKVGSRILRHHFSSHIARLRYVVAGRRYRCSMLRPENDEILQMRETSPLRCDEAIEVTA
jgi:hypothetical protein